MPKQRDARALGYQVNGDAQAGFYYERPNGESDSEGFDTEAEAWEAAESDASLWNDDHGEGLDAIDTLATVQRIFATTPGWREYADDFDPADMLAKIAAAVGEPMNGAAGPVEGGAVVAFTEAEARLATLALGAAATRWREWSDTLAHPGVAANFAEQAAEADAIALKIAREA